jgi:hypothetical protein
MKVVPLFQLSWCGFDLAPSVPKLNRADRSYADRPLGATHDTFHHKGLLGFDLIADDTYVTRSTEGTTHPEHGAS